jgi:hypothetical protein
MRLQPIVEFTSRFLAAREIQFIGASPDFYESLGTDSACLG